MNLLLCGPVEGFLTPLFEHAEHEDAHWIVCSGDFGIWPDPDRRDRASRVHAGVEFASRYVGAEAAPIKIPVLTVAGVHDDNRWLNHRQAVNNTEILSNVHWLAQGYKTTIGFDGKPLRVSGLGRAYSEATYNGQFSKRSHRHYTRRDVERACSSGPTDLLVVYEHLDAPGIRNVIFATRPQLILTVEHNNRLGHPEIQGIPVVTLGRCESKRVVWDNGQFSL